MYRSKIIKVGLVCIAAYLGAGGMTNVSAAEKSTLEWSASAGLGYDSNVFRAPSDSYIDYGKSFNADQVGRECVELFSPSRGRLIWYCTVDPEVQSGMVIPLEVDAEYTKSTSDANRLVADYKFDAGLYPESKFENANQFYHRFEFGDEYTYNKKGRREDTIYVGGRIEYRKRLYLDRDTGEEQEFNGTVVSKRYTYTAAGVEAELENKTSKIQYSLNARFLDRNYEDPVQISEYDHVYYRLGGELEFDLAKHSKLSLDYDYYVYDYSDRPSRSADGRLLTANPTREYEYNVFGITLRHRFSKAWLVYFDYENKERTDKYVGYDNYTKDLFKARIRYDINRNNELKLDYSYWERDYPNAYAFDSDALGIQKQYDGTETEVVYIHKLDKHKNFNVEFTYVDENSTDLRYAYERFVTFATIEWEY
jgi:hypothetical protein